MTTRTVTKALLASVAAGLVTFAMGPAHAATAPRSTVVHFDDLNLGTADGQAKLGRRIAYAAETVCGPVDELSYFSRKAATACQDDAIANAKRGLVEVFARADNSIRVAAN